MEHNAAGDSVVVVGAGMVGIACAHYLTEAGYRVTVIDRSTIAGACSEGNLGYICPSHVLPLTEPGAIGTAMRSFFDSEAAFRFAPRLSLAFWNWMWQFVRRCTRRQMITAGTHLKAILDMSIEEYRGLFAANTALDSEWWESGLLQVARTESGMRELAEKDRFLSKHFSLSARRIEGPDLPDFDPAIKAGLAGAYYYDDDGLIRPDLLSRSWSDYLKQNGVRFVENCSLTGIEKAGSAVSSIQTAHGSLSADHFVFAVGAWSARLSDQLGCRIPVEPGKGYSVTMTRPGVCPKYPMLFPEHNVGVTPFADSYRLGSMMEFVGFDTSIPAARIQQLKESAAPYLVEPYTNIVKDTWYGWRPMTWDSLPIIGRTPRLENAWLATGHNMLGISLAAGTGRLIAEMLQGQVPVIDTAAFSPGRF